AHPELAPLAARLLEQWPGSSRGVHRIDFPDLGVALDVVVADASPAVGGWLGKADAWFLDGFSPPKNPEMWGADLLAMVGRATAPGGRAATWCAAAAVREKLTAAGFAVSKQSGFAQKRHRLEAKMPGDRADPVSPRVAVIGAGIAGAALSLALADLGVMARVFADGPMASGNPAALVSPRLAAGSAAGAALHAQAFARAVARIGRTAQQAIIARGALHVPSGPGEAARAKATRDSGLFDDGALALGDIGLWMADGLVVAPDRLRAAWLPVTEQLNVGRVERAADGWWLEGPDRREGPFEAVCLAAGFATARIAGLPLRPVRGQVTLADLPLPGPPTSWGGYVIPTDAGLLFGATHGRDDSAPDVRGEDQHRNLEGLARMMPQLAAQLGEVQLGAVAGIRAAAADHQPLAGALGDGLFVLGGLGGRGFTLAPLLAEHVAALVVGAPSPLLAPQAALVDPARFRRGWQPDARPRIRALRRK
ncbi:MAG: FAD-dependent oxidoreductase, partial [Sandaracinobacteroides sp.]